MTGSSSRGSGCAPGACPCPALPALPRGLKTNDHIARLRGKYDDHPGCMPSIALDCRDLQRHYVMALKMVAFGYRLESSRRPYHVVITAGMSQVRMYFTPYIGSVRRSSELICYLNVLGGKDLRRLQWLAGLPFHGRLAPGHGHSVAFGFPFYEHSLLRHLLLLPAPLGEDAALFDGFDLLAHPANPLWVVPLTEQEYQVKVSKHLEGIVEVLNDVGHPPSLDRHRHRYAIG